MLSRHVLRSRLLGPIAATLFFTQFGPALSAQIRASIYAPPASSANTQIRKNAVPGCPNQGGILNSVSVPVGMPLDLAVVISVPAPAGGARFQLKSDDPSVVAAGDKRQGFLPIVTVPAGQTVSNNFTIFGITVGKTSLEIIPLTAGFVGNAVPLGAWDVNQSGSDAKSKFLDANNPDKACRENGADSFSVTPTLQATCGKVVQSVASDGLNALLLRTLSGLPGTSCFEIVSSSNLDEGTIQTPLTTTQTVAPTEYGFSYYTPPSYYGDTSNNRTLEVEFTFTPNIGNGNTTKFRAKTMIVRPPVVLIHGIWSSRGAWSSDYKKEDAFHTTFVADYEATNAASFSTNVGAIQDDVKTALKNARDKKVGVTQVDVIGHSMGGILTRLYIGGNKFMRPENLDKGDIRRLITLDTPHSGSTFPNLVVALHRLKPAAADATVKGITGYPPAGGAVCDLAENSPALKGLNAVTTIKAQAIIGTGGPAPPAFFGGFFGFGNIEGAVTKKECLHRNRFFMCDQEDFIYPQAVVDAFRFKQINDTTVALISQQDGYCKTPGLAGIPFHVIHTGPSVVNGVLNTGAVAQRAYQLLDGPDSGFESSFPAIASTGTGVACTVTGTATDAADYTNQCVSGPLKSTVQKEGNIQKASAPLAAAADSRVQITSPANGQVFAPGDTVNITVKLTRPLTANNIEVDLSGALGQLDGTIYDGTTFQASFAIPDFIAGPITLTPDITDTNNVPILGVPITIAVRPVEAPLSIGFQQKYFHASLPVATPSGTLALTGTYTGGLTRDLTSAAAGTTYSTTDPAVVSISSDGVYQIKGAGVASITAKNSGLSDFATFVVDETNGTLPPADLSQQFAIQRGGFRLDRTTGFFVQNVTITNSASVPVTGPLYLLVSGLPAGVELVDRSGFTQQIQPGTSFVTLPSGPDGLTIPPGQSIELTLQFLNQGRATIAYSTSVIRTFATP